MSRPGHGTIVAYLALFVALGGGAYAAANLPDNSVGAKQLKKNAVTSSKIAANAVDGSKVKNKSLTGNDILVSTLGKVPSAASAENAGHATTADNATGLGTLPSGHSESGVWATASGNSTGGVAAAVIQFPIPLAGALAAGHAIYVTGASATHCSGPGHADPGYLCAYQGEAGRLTLFQFITPGGGATASSAGGAARTGSAIQFSVTATQGYADGQWTVTAP